LSKNAVLNFKLTNHTQQKSLVCQMRLVDSYFGIAFCGSSLGLNPIYGRSLPLLLGSQW